MAHGFDGSITVFPQAFMSFRGLPPGFSELLGVDAYRVDVGIHPNPEGSLELNARLEKALYVSNFEQDLGSDVPRGSVWLSDQVAYGHNAGADPDEWAAFDMGSELVFVRVFHRGDTSQLLGRDAFVRVAVDTVGVMRSVGFSRSPTVEDDAFRGAPELAAMLLVALVTDCDGAVCRQVQAPSRG